MDIESYIKGAQEIDRMNGVIKRVFGTLHSIIKKIDGKLPVNLERSLQIQCGPVLINVKREQMFEVLESGKEDTVWYCLPGSKWRNPTTMEDLPMSQVRIVYDALPIIVENLDKQFPELGIRHHFEFVIQFAPK